MSDQTALNPPSRVLLPASEVCLYLRVTGRRMAYELVPDPRGGEPAVQLLNDDGRPFSIPITLGEAGLTRDPDGKIHTLL
jgi:hypothetical protein